MSEIKTINGHSLKDYVARQEILGINSFLAMKVDIPTYEMAVADINNRIDNIQSSGGITEDTLNTILQNYVAKYELSNIKLKTYLHKGKINGRSISVKSTNIMKYSNIRAFITSNYNISPVIMEENSLLFHWGSFDTGIAGEDGLMLFYRVRENNTFSDISLACMGTDSLTDYTVTEIGT